MLSEKQIKDAENFGREDGFTRKGCEVHYKKPDSVAEALNQPADGLFATFQTEAGAISFLASVEGLRFFMRRSRELAVAASLYSGIRKSLPQKQRDELVDLILEGVRSMNGPSEEAEAEVAKQSAMKDATEAIEKVSADVRKRSGN